MSKRSTYKAKPAVRYARAAASKPRSKVVYVAPKRRAASYKPAALRGYGAYSETKESKKKPKSYGQRLGSVLGEGAERVLSLMGFGDYVQAPWATKLKKNSVYMGADPPSIINSPMGNVIVRHREYLGDVTTGSASAFSNTSYAVNPGLPHTFPWLSQIATCFEQYSLRGCVFEFKSTSADALNSTNTALGSVIMATEYDSTRPAFANKQQMENHQYAMSARQSNSMLHPIECAKGESTLETLYVRAGADSGDDTRFTDFCNFQIATVGQQASDVVIGELWISYEIELLKPRFATSEGSGSVYSSHVRCTTNILNTNFFGDTQTVSGNLAISVGTNALQFPDFIKTGHYLVVIVWNGTSASVGLPTFTFTNSALEQVWYVNTASSISNTSTTATRLICAFELNINGADAEILLTSGTGVLPVASTSVDVVITSMNPLATVGEEMVDTILGVKLPMMIAKKEFPQLMALPIEEKEIKGLTPLVHPEKEYDYYQAVIDRVKAKQASVTK